MIQNKKLGFTLVELLIVIAILALIANVTMVSLTKAKRESRDTTRMSDINQIRNALQLYSSEKLSYPDDSDLALGAIDTLILDINGWVDGSSPTSPVFMYSVPRDPSMKARLDNDPCTSSSAGICDYGYTVNGNDYEVYFFLEGDLPGMEPGLHRATKDKIE